ncbi:chromate transporter [Trinickia symbiotica]|uniref:chromate transporter n=1 Tax=Trinickia symbiotica TaxID=863227 RepID=UPI0037DD974E
MGTIDASHAIKAFDAFYRSGALVFGGGHVALPVLGRQTVATGWGSPNDLHAGYGAAQAVRGLFSRSPRFSVGCWQGRPVT